MVNDRLYVLVTMDVRPIHDLKSMMHKISTETSVSLNVGRRCEPKNCLGRKYSLDFGW
jgi:hypothetical protein